MLLRRRSVNSDLFDFLYSDCLLEIGGGEDDSEEEAEHEEAAESRKKQKVHHVFYAYIC